MGVNRFKIKKWINMLTGKSLLYVNQGLGQLFVPGEIKGYFNDLTEKVTKDIEALSTQSLPKSKNENGDDIIFATTIFQYGLGCYDLILQTDDQQYVEQFQNCVNWAVNNQDENGGWDISAYAGNRSRYGSMALAEGISLLSRAFIYTNDIRYKNAAIKAGNLLILSVDNGGTCLLENNRCVFLEFLDKPTVLNGWIFSIFGLYDLTLIEDSEIFKIKLNQTINTLKNELPNYDNGYWSLYDCGGSIASPFYHKLHIAQLEALVMIEDCEIFETTLSKYRMYQSRGINKLHAFICKAIQKVVE